jgi:radical SAM superfamily enzyme YgiQ (UPF0313 family)
VFDLEAIRMRERIPQAAEFITNCVDDIADLINEVERLQRQHEISQAQIKSYEKALGWYADPANWIEQVDDRGRETMLWKWAEDGGDMARHALAVWRESRKSV